MMAGSASASAPASAPPYRWAVAVAALVLAGLVVSLAPSVTFWDAGELTAAMRILGIPHPPGTPLFVMMGHVFGMMVPFGEFAFRTNLQTALFAALASGFWFLVLDEVAGRYLGEDRRSAGWTRLAAAAAGTVIAAFGFTNWLNSNETEVYSVSTFTIAVVVWLMLRWRAARVQGQGRGERHLLLVGYLLGVAIGNHLLGLLVGPAIVAFMYFELRGSPASDPEVRRKEWGDTAIMAGLWALLTGVGLGSQTLTVFGGIAFLAALIFAGRHRGRELGFGLLLLAIALVGVTPYLFLYLRAGQAPMINEADPSTWNALIDVIRRAQYEVRTPFDDPTFLHDDPANPGRGLRIIGLQLVNYFQYFDWQWAKSVRQTLAGFPVRTLFTVLFVTLGIRGLVAQWRSDRSGAWLLLTLFVMTGLGLMAYMNFKPGYTVGFEWYPDPNQHEVRERDYFFVVSFVVWGLWCGLGLLTLVRAPGPSGGTGTAPVPRSLRTLAAPAIFLLALIPFALNFADANRRFGRDARLPGDFAYNLLNSVPPYGILFTYGDNDTFPLWWAQEVEGIRRDVTVVCLALAETEWYMRQLRDNPVRPFERDGAPAIWRDIPATAPTWPLHTMTDAEITAALPQLLREDVSLPVAQHRITLRANTPLYPKDFLSLRVIQQNFGRRPIGWALTAAGQSYGMDQFLVQRGLAIVLESDPVDTTRLDYDFRRMLGAPLDVPVTERLMEETYRYAGLLERTGPPLESTASGISSTLGLPFTQLAFVMEARGNAEKLARYLDRSLHLTRNPTIAARLESLRAR